jgi:hypothetical protein
VQKKHAGRKKTCVHTYITNLGGVCLCLGVCFPEQPIVQTGKLQYMYTLHIHVYITHTCLHHTYMYTLHIHIYITHTYIHYTNIYTLHIHIYITHTHIHHTHIYAHKMSDKPNWALLPCWREGSRCRTVRLWGHYQPLHVPTPLLGS